MIHELKFKNKDTYKKDNIINLEEKKDGKFYWKEIDELNKCKPEIVFKRLNDTEFFHMINNDMKK